jgi:hypothetical protein
MAEKKVTIENILSEDNKKHLAELLLSDKITNMVIIYRKGDNFHCDVSDQAVANVIGMLEMARAEVMNNWLHPEEIDLDDGGEDEGDEYR